MSVHVLEWRRLGWMVLGVVVAATVEVPLLAEEAKPLVYVATYSPVEGEGIFVASFDPATGNVGALRPTGGLRSPAALVVHPRERILYATSLTMDADQNPTGAIAALAIAPTGELKEIDRRPSGGTGPCYLAADNNGDCLLVANCGTATIGCLGLRSDGRFSGASTILQHEGVSRNSEGKPQAHSINVAPGGRFAIAADLGLDRLFLYRLDSQRARLDAHDPPFAKMTPGSGPRHLAFPPRGRFVYSVNELGNTVTCCKFEEQTGALEVVQDVSTLPEGFCGESFAAEVQAHPSGRFLYASNRGHDSLAMFSIDSDSGRLGLIGHAASGGKFPRHFAIDPGGRHLIVANQQSDRLSLFEIDAETGRLTLIGSPIAVPLPVCVRILIRS
jgi:6-phosphogluconolactonase